MTERVLVPFAGEGSGEEPLTWGQRNLWDGMRTQNTWMPLASVQALPAGTAIEQVVAELRFGMQRYPSMRTRLRLTEGMPRQVLASSGELPLDIVDVAGEADPAEVAEQTKRRYCADAYDFENDWPLRTAVIRHRGTLTHQVNVVCHLAIDGFGAVVMLDELAQWRATGRVAASHPAIQPLQQAQWQRSPAGLRQSARAMRYWERLLRSVPAQRFSGSTDPRCPRHWEAGLTSRALHLAVQAIGARTGLASAPVLLAVYAVALGRITGISPSVVRALVSNRFWPGLAGSVSPVTLPALFVIDVADTTVEQVVTRTARQVFAAHRYAYYDPAQVYALVDRLSRERGEEIDIHCFFNDRRLAARNAPAAPGAPTAPAPTPEQIRVALPETTFRWVGQYHDSNQPFFVHVNDVPETVDLSIYADTHRVSPADMEACVREMEAAAVEAAADPAAPTRVQPVLVP